MLASIVSLSLFAVTQTPQPASIEVFTTLSSSSALQADRRDAIRAFLADRVRDAFGIEVGETPPIDARGPAYAVGLHYEGEARVLVEVSRDGELLASRPIEVRAQISETCADVWMLVRSSIERDEKELAVLADTPPIFAVPTATIASVEPVEPVASSSVSTVASATPARSEPVSIVRSSPLGAAPWGVEEIKSISATLMTEAAVNGGFGFGPAASASLELERGVIVGASLAYRSTTLADGLDVTRVPISIRAGYVPVNSFDVETGVSLSLDLGVASTSIRNDAIIGINAGPYVRGRVPITEWEGAQISGVAEMGIAIALLRSSYFIAGNEYSDGLLSARAMAGVEWRWR